MHLRHINECAATDERAIIINVNTKLVTTLALISALKYADMPILVIDCASTDGSMQHFTELMTHYQFDLLSAPLQNHGYTLDWLFMNIPAQKVLLIDSDVEILGDEIINLMKMVISARNVFGSGFIHGGEFMTSHNMTFGYYEERAWLPLVMFNVPIIREALAEHLSFLPRTIHNDFPPSKFISRMLIKRFRIPVLKKLRLAWLDIFRRDFHSIKPSFIQYDTGAELYQHLKHERHYDLIAFPWRLSERYVKHFHGVTRLRLNKRDRHGARLSDIIGEIEWRLHERYGLSVADPEISC